MGDQHDLWIPSRNELKRQLIIMKLNKSPQEGNNSELATWFFILLIIPSAVWHAFVLLNLYNWFLLPIKGAPAVTLGNMLGFFLIVNFSLYNTAKTELGEVDNWLDALIVSLYRMIVIPALFLLFGWIFQFLLMR